MRREGRVCRDGGINKTGESTATLVELVDARILDGCLKGGGWCVVEGDIGGDGYGGG